MAWGWSIIAAAAALAIGYLTWRKWIAPWKELEQLIGDIRAGRQPRTFLIGDTANEPHRVGLALEDVFKRQQSLDQQLAEHTSGIETIAGAMQDGLLVVDSKHRITIANSAFRELFALTDPVPPVPLLEVIRNPDIDRLIAETLRTGKPQRRELDVVEPNRSARCLQLSAVTVVADGGEINGAVVLFHDITQLKQGD